MIGFANAAAGELAGLPAARLTGRGLWEALPWLGQPASEDHFRGAYLSGEAVRFEARRGEDADPPAVSVGL
ncbi:hypothetical protein PL81_13405, partial [Streptomyces sp. RSD-27]